MKTIKFLSVVFFCLVCMGTVLFNSGCTMLDRNPAAGSPCLDIAPEASYICSITGNPQDLSFLLKLANAAAMKKNVYKATQALEVVDKLTTVLEKGITYQGLMELLGREVDPVLFVVITEYQDQFMALDIPILPYDMELILLHLSKQRAIIMMAIEAYGASVIRPGETECRGSAGPYRPDCGDLETLAFAGPAITGTGGVDRLYLARGGAGF